MGTSWFWISLSINKVAFSSLSCGCVILLVLSSLIYVIKVWILSGSETRMNFLGPPRLLFNL